MKRFLRAVLAGTFLGALSRHLALALGAQQLNKGYVAPDELMDPFLGALTGYLIERAKNKWSLSKKQVHALVALAIGARTGYEIAELLLGQGVTPISRPHSVGSIKDALTFTASLGLYVRSKDVPSPPEGGRAVVPRGLPAIEKTREPEV